MIIAPSFADIFYGNCINNQIVPVTLEETQIDTLFAYVAVNEGATVTLDLPAQTVRAGEHCFAFQMDDFRRHCLLEGLDSIGLTLQHEAEISLFEQQIPSFLT